MHWIAKPLITISLLTTKSLFFYSCSCEEDCKDEFKGGCLHYFCMDYKFDCGGGSNVFECRNIIGEIDI